MQQECILTIELLRAIHLVLNIRCFLDLEGLWRYLLASRCRLNHLVDLKGEAPLLCPEKIFNYLCSNSACFLAMSHYISSRLLGFDFVVKDEEYFF